MDKACTKCGEVKSVNDFYKGRADCKECVKSWRRRRYLITKNYYDTEDGWINQMLANKRLYCKNHTLPYDLLNTWLKDKLCSGCCEATGISFDVNKGGRSPFGPSIDRIDPNGGYTMDNCRVVVNCYNLAKSNWSDDDVFRMAQAVVSKRERRNSVDMELLNDELLLSQSIKTTRE